MGDNQRKRIWILRTDMDKVDVYTINVRNELRESVELRFSLAPVVITRPIFRERLHCFKLYTLRRICHQLFFRPARCLDSHAEVPELRFGSFEAERTNGGVFCHTLSHAD